MQKGKQSLWETKTSHAIYESFHPERSTRPGSSTSLRWHTCSSYFICNTGRLRFFRNFWSIDVFCMSPAADQCFVTAIDDPSPVRLRQGSVSLWPPHQSGSLPSSVTRRPRPSLGCPRASGHLLPIVIDPKPVQSDTARSS